MSSPKESKMVETLPTDYDHDLPMPMAVVGFAVEIVDGQQVVSFTIEDRFINQRLTAAAAPSLVDPTKYGEFTLLVGSDSVVTFTPSGNGPQQIATIKAA